MKVSIVILGHNARLYFHDCLGVIFARTFQDFQVLWADSAFSDDLPLRFQIEFPKI